MEDFKDLSGGSVENAGTPDVAEEAQKHLDADPNNLSFEDLDTVAGGRGRKKYQPRPHIGPDAPRPE